MDEINFNPNDPTDVNSGLIITDAMVSTAFRVVSGDFCYYASVYTEHNVGIYNQFYNAETRRTEPEVAATYNNAWEAAYNNMYRLKIIIDKCSEGGSEEGNYHTLGAAQVLTAINLATLTDCVGDAPYAEALLPGEVFTPNLDSQESIYAEVISLLTKAAENLVKESNFAPLGDQDVIFGSSETANLLWQKTAYGLLARYTMRQSKLSPDYNKVIEYANKSFADASEECKLKWDLIGGLSPFAALFRDRDYYGASESLKNKLTSLVDPRLDYFWKAHPTASEDDLVFAKNGDADDAGQLQEVYSVSAITDKAAPTFLISYHEVEFLKAEAYTRQSKATEAKEALKSAVVAAFVKISHAVVDADFTMDDLVEEAETYYTSTVESRYDSNGLNEVMIQKYIACFEEEALEAYADIRRLKAMGEGDIIELAHPEPAKFPVRYTYGSSDVTTNNNVAGAYESVNVYTDNVWWAGGSK